MRLLLVSYLLVGCDGVGQAPRVEGVPSNTTVANQDADQTVRPEDKQTTDTNSNEQKETTNRDTETTAESPVVFQLSKLYLQSSQTLHLTINTTDAFKDAKWSLNDFNNGFEYFSGVEFQINKNVQLGLNDSMKYQLRLDIAARYFPQIKNRLVMILEKNGRTSSYETPDFEVQDFSAFYSSGLGDSANTVGWFMPMATLQAGSELQPISGQVFFAN
jgi:hypothetical protein